MEYLKVFETIEEQQSYLNGTIITPSVTIARNDNSTISYVPKVIDEEVSKIVNHGTLTLNPPLDVVITWEYPLASDFEIFYYYSSTSPELPVRISVPEPVVSRMNRPAFKGQSITEITFGPGEIFMRIDSIDPPEDDTYIYEIISEN